MNVLLSCDQISKAFGTKELFNDTCLQIHAKERIGLIGPNGAGKSTLLQILAGLIEPDSGSITKNKSIRLGYIPQFETVDDNLTVLEAALQASTGDPEQDFEKETQAIVTLGKMGFNNIDQPVSTLSGGWHKRLCIARQLAREPDILLLDEPTNHLDVEGIEWLEQFLAKAKFSFILISHDRMFLEQATNRIIELNAMFDDGILSFNCAYNEFMRRRGEFLESEQARYESLANKSRREQEWAKAGVKARGTKSRSRLQEAENLRQQVKQLQKQTAEDKKVQIKFDQTDRKTKRLVVADQVSKSYAKRPIVKNFDLILTPGMTIGLLGPNGVGKTTLMKLLAGELAPDSGQVKIADNCKILHFDQQRQLEDETQTLKEALSLTGGDTVIYRGKQMHVSALAQKLKFRPEQLIAPISSLSGGERARVIIGRLMLQPADVLLLDEPTNDLDIPSIEVLEQSIREFPGAVLLVTHDRQLLNNVASMVLAMDGTGGITSYADYQQWRQTQTHTNQTAKANKKSSPKAKTQSKPAKLSYKDKLELDGIEARIEQAEAKLATLQNNPAPCEPMNAYLDYCEQLKQAQQQVDDLYKRWTELEQKSQSKGE